MHVLLTNQRLDEWAGAELYLRDVAVELMRRGCSVAVYSPKLGAFARSLEDLTIPVTDDLSALGQVPDVIHGQRHLPTMAALHWFPSAPVVSVCHGWRPWIDQPAIHPNVKRYVAVDAAGRDRLVHRHGVEPARVHVIENFVDTERFRRVASPTSLRRILLFSNYVEPTSPYLRAAREATEELGLDLDVVGERMGTRTEAPEDLLGDYDVVLAQGRSAYEAMAVGAAVVICSSRAFGPMVTSDQFARLRADNFGIRTLRHPVSRDVLVEQLRRFDPDDAARVTDLVRSTATVGAAVDALVAVYELAVEEAGTELAGEDAFRATARVLHGVALHSNDIHSRFQLLQPLRGQLAYAQRERDAVREQLNRLQADRDSAPSPEAGPDRDEVARLRAQVAELEGSAAFRLRRRVHRSRTLTRLYRLLRR